MVDIRSLTVPLMVLRIRSGAACLPGLCLSDRRATRVQAVVIHRSAEHLNEAR